MAESILGDAGDDVGRVGGLLELLPAPRLGRLVEALDPVDQLDGLLGLRHQLCVVRFAGLLLDAGLAAAGGRDRRGQQKGGAWAFPWAARERSGRDV